MPTLLQHYSFYAPQCYLQKYSGKVSKSRNITFSTQTDTQSRQTMARKLPQQEIYLKSTLKYSKLTKQQCSTEQIFAELTDFNRISVTRNCRQQHTLPIITETLASREENSFQIDGLLSVHCSRATVLHTYFRLNSLKQLHFSQILIKAHMT